MPCGCLKPKCGSQSAVNFACENDGRDVEFISLAEFLPRVTLIAKGVPDDVALEYLRQAAQTLARDSLLLKRELRLDVQAGVRDYYLDNGDAEQVHYVDEIHLGKRKPYSRVHYKPMRYSLAVNLPLSQTTKSFCKKPHVLMRKISFTFATLPFQPKMRAKWINSCLTAITMWWSTVHWHNCF